MRALLVVAGVLLFAAPAFADDTVVVPDNGSTVIQQDDGDNDKGIIIQRQPDDMDAPEDRDDETAEPDNGASSGDEGVGVETRRDDTDR